MHFPTWIDLKGQDSVPETVHHVVCTLEWTWHIAVAVQEMCIKL